MFRLILLLLMGVSIQIVGKAQKTDIELVMAKPIIKAEDYAYYKRSGNDAKLMEMRKRTLFSKINPVSWLFRGAMFTYQNVISPQLSKTCPYEITCSNFSKQAIKKFGLIKGVCLSADRVMRCNRIALSEIGMTKINRQNGSIIDPLNDYE